eukprot:TRINITY_DN72614_c0_g1_i1.p1 TRINITY_DN72614_c0_g1~~TRINITY_DN72614_c0_g1_i1.p1  ORF type:complete len:355 (-),score=17.26 TRINITY_DN72614_c0_g1_i1:283-1347(-)
MGGGEGLSGEGKTVCVTGASGFIGSHLVKLLLQKGYTVRGTVRDAKDEAKTGWIKALAEGTPGTLQLYSADLSVPGSYDEPLAGCALVCHTAAYVRMVVSDPQKVVDAALEGTRNVFASILKHKVAKRVVLTSSVAAVADRMAPKGHVFTDADWNRELSLKDPYPMGKTLAERYAWKAVEELKGQDWTFELVTICPSMVYGTAYRKEHARTSLQVVKQLMDGSMPAAPALSLSLVHVADVVQAHAEALERPEASGRYILSNGDTLTLLEMANILRRTYPAYSLPSVTMPNFLTYLLSLVNPHLSFDILWRYLGRKDKFDGSRAVKELGLEYVTSEAMLIETVVSLLDLGLLQKK